MMQKIMITMTMMTMTINTLFPDVELYEGCPPAYTEISPPWENILGKQIGENILGKIYWVQHTLRYHHLGKNLINILAAIEYIWLAHDDDDDKNHQIWRGVAAAKHWQHVRMGEDSQLRKNYIIKYI